MIQRLSVHDDFFFDDFEEKLLDLEDAKIERYLRRKKGKWCKPLFMNIVWALSTQNRTIQSLETD